MVCGGGLVAQVWPVTGGSPFFIATRVQTANQTLVCQVPSASHEACQHTYQFGCDNSFNVDPECNNFAQASYFVADIERFTLLLDHTVQSPTQPSLKVCGSFSAMLFSAASTVGCAVGSLNGMAGVRYTAHTYRVMRPRCKGICALVTGACACVCVREGEGWRRTQLLR